MGHSLPDALRLALRLVWTESDTYTRARLLASFLLLTVIATMSAGLPVLFKLIVDGFSGETIPVAPMTLLFAYVFGQLAMNTAGDFRPFIHGTAAQRLNRRISMRLFDHILRLPLSYHLERRTGAIGETISQGLAACQTLLQHVAFTFLPVVIELAAIVVVLIHFGHPLYLAILAVSAVAYAFIFWRGAASIVEPSREVSGAQIDSQALLTDSLINTESVKHFCAEPTMSLKYDKAMTRRENAWRRLLIVQTHNGLAATTVFISSLALSLGLAGHEVLAGTMTIGDLVLIAGYVARLLQPLEAIGFAARDVSQSVVFIQRMLDVLTEKPESATPHPPHCSPIAGQLAFERVSLEYQRGRRVLNEISFEIPAGSTTAIVGASGSGKSSLIRILLRLYEPTAGRVLLDGMPLSQWPISLIRRMIGVVPQDTVLIDDTIAANIALGNPEATFADIRSAALLAHLDSFISALPDGYETRVGERGVKLSGGEKQRVAIARAALKNPRIFVFDEATSSLDSGMESAIVESLLQVAKGCTTILIAHRLSTVVHADEILVLSNGSLVERGTHSTLLRRAGIYSDLWRAQQRLRYARKEPGPETTLGVSA